MAPNQNQNQQQQQQSLFTRYLNLFTDTTHSVRNSALRSADSLGKALLTFARYSALALAAGAILVLLSWVMISIATVIATGSAISVRMFALWGVPQDAEIPLPFDFSHRSQKCILKNSYDEEGDDDEEVDSTKTKSRKSSSSSSSSCAIATSTVHVRCLMNFTKPSPKTSSWSDYFPFFSSNSNNNNNGMMIQENEDENDYFDTELIPFLDPAYDFVAGARYALSVEMYVPTSAVCLGMLTTQMELHTLPLFLIDEAKRNENDGKISYTSSSRSNSKKNKKNNNMKYKCEEEVAEGVAMNEREEEKRKRKSNPNEEKSQKPIFTAAASAAVVANSDLDAIEENASEFWLTRLCRNLFFLPIQIFIPGFGRHGFISYFASNYHNSLSYSSSSSSGNSYYGDGNSNSHLMLANKELLKFDLIQRFAPPKKVANLIRYLNFSIFTQNSNGACCNKNSIQNNKNNKQQQQFGSDCLRIFNPVLKIRVELDSLLARIHQNYPMTSFFVVFIPVWCFVFCITGAILLGIVYMLFQQQQR